MINLVGTETANCAASVGSECLMLRLACGKYLAYCNVFTPMIIAHSISADIRAADRVTPKPVCTNDSVIEIRVMKNYLCT